MRPPRVASAVALAAVLSAAAAAGQPARLEGWVRVDSAHFSLLSDAAPERAVEITAGLERFREAFARLAPEMRLHSPVPTRLVAFRDDASYAPYKTRVDRGGVRTLGQFLAHPDGNFLTLNADPKYLGALATVYHEYAHELVSHNFRRVPLWFNEGLAEYYSTFAVEGDRAMVGRPVARHLEWLRSHPRFSVVEVLAAGRGRGPGHGVEEAGQLYAVSWLLVHYLLSGSEQRLAATADFLYRLERGEEPEDALEGALGIGAWELEETLRDYLLAGNLPQAAWPLAASSGGGAAASPASPVDVLVELGDLALRLDRAEEAGRHFELALAYDGFSGAAHSGLAAARDAQARLEEAGLLHADAVRLAGGVAAIRLRYGRHLVRRLQETPPGELGEPPADVAARARAEYAAAARLAPDFPECRVQLGVAQLLPGGDPERGVELVEAARRELPPRADLLFNLVQLYLAADRVEPALALVGGELGRTGNAELVARAREAVERTSLLKAARRAFDAGAVDEALALFDQAVDLTTDPALRAHLEAELTRLQARVGAG